MCAKIKPIAMLLQVKLLSFLLFFSFVFLFYNCDSVPDKIAIWHGGSVQGNFDFDLCQNQLDYKLSDVTEAVSDASFSTAFLFASTANYDFINLKSTIGMSDDSLVSFFTSNKLTDNTSTVELSDFLSFTSPEISQSAIYLFINDDTDNFPGLGLSSSASIWTFTTADGTYDVDNCNGATSIDESTNGASLSLSGKNMGVSTDLCSSSLSVICIAK